MRQRGHLEELRRGLKVASWSAVLQGVSTGVSVANYITLNDRTTLRLFRPSYTIQGKEKYLYIGGMKRYQITMPKRSFQVL
jgi:hypothetical protein